jgi:serine/threonine protein kinase
MQRPIGDTDMEKTREAAVLAYKRRIEDSPPFNLAARYADVRLLREAHGDSLAISTALYALTQQPIVIKGRKNILTGSAGALMHCILEAFVLETVLSRHPAIVRLHSVLRDCNHDFLLEFEYHPGTLSGLSVTPGFWSAERARLILLGLASAVAHCHSRKVVHCDIKLDNILWTSRGTPCLADFGSAHILDRGYSTYPGEVNAVGYRAPETLLGLPWAFPVDVWAMACSLIDMYYAHLGRPTPFMYAEAGWDVHLRHVCGLAGPVPDNMLRAAVEMHGMGLPGAMAAGFLHGAVSGFDGLDAADALLYGTLVRMLAPDPARRMTAAAILLEPLDSRGMAPYWTALRKESSKTDTQNE